MQNLTARWTAFFGLFSFVSAASAFATDESRFANLPPYPCTQGTVQIDIGNSDDLYFAGRWLVRHQRVKEGVQCLNRAKRIAPGYLDVRLELMSAFHLLRDKKSAMNEAIAFRSYPANSYYLAVYELILQRVVAMKKGIKPLDGFAYEPVFGGMGPAYRRLVEDEEIIDEAKLVQAIEERNAARLEFAFQLGEEVLALNPNSVTARYYSAFLAYSSRRYELSVNRFAEVYALIGFDQDLVLGRMRALLAFERPSEALRVGRESRAWFSSYGCFQLGSAWLEALRMNMDWRADPVSSLLDRAINGNLAPDTVCQELARF